MPKVKQLSNKEKKALSEEFKKYGLTLEGNLEQTDLDKFTLILQDKKPFGFKQREIWLPTLQTILEKNTNLANVYIDLGAVPFITKGADLMKAGLKRQDKFEKNSFVVIRDEKHNKPLAVGEALFSSEEIAKMEKGKVILNLHHIGDKIWAFSKDKS